MFGARAGRHAIGFAAAVVVMSAGLVAGFGPSGLVEASAAGPPCPVGYLCFWAGSNGSTAGPGELAGTNPNWGWFGQSACHPPNAAADSNNTWNDCASSIKNNGTSYCSLVWYNASYGGFAVELSRGEWVSDLHSFNMNDAISSNSWTGC